MQSALENDRDKNEHVGHLTDGTGSLPLSSIAPELASRIWDLSDGRLVNGMWTRCGDAPVLEPFGGTVHEFQVAMEAEIDLDPEEEPGIEFLRQLRDTESFRDSSAKSRKSSPIVSLFGGSLPGVTRPMWILPDEEGKVHEFGSEEDANIFQIKVAEKKRLADLNEKARKTFRKAKDAVTAMRMMEKFKKVSSPSAAGNPLANALNAMKQTTENSAVTVNNSVMEVEAEEPERSESEQSYKDENEVQMAFDSLASIGISACRPGEIVDDRHLKRRLRDVIDNKVNSTMLPRKQFLRSQVQDALQVFAQVIEDEDAVTVCNFVGSLILKPVLINTAPENGTGTATKKRGAADEEFRRREREIFESKLTSFELLKDEPVCMLGLALKEMRPLRPRVIVVVERSKMELALRALIAGSQKETGGGLKNLYPALGWVLVPDGTNLPIAKANFMIALARVLRRHALAVVCGGGLGVLNQMHQAAQWDVPMMILHGSGRVSDIWMKLWPRRTSQGFDAGAVHKKLQSCAGYSIQMHTTHLVREILKKGNLMLHTIDANSNAFERLFRIELNGDQLIGTALRRLHSYELTIRIYSRYKNPLASFAIFVGLCATLASVFVSNLDVFGGGSNQIWAATILKWVAVIAPAVLVVLNSIENFVNLSSMLVIAERARARVESLLHVYRLRALQFSDSFIDKERDSLLEAENLLKAKRDQKIGRLTSVGDPYNLGSNEDSATLLSKEADDEDQETGDIITLRQSKLAEILEAINRDFSESGAVLLELKNLTTGSTSANSATSEGSVATAVAALHRRRVPSKSRKQKQTAAAPADPEKADASDDDLHPSMMSPRQLGKLQSVSPGMIDFKGSSVGGHSTGGARFKSQNLSLTQHRMSFQTESASVSGSNLSIPGQRLALPSTQDVAADNLTANQRLLLSASAHETGITMPRTRAVELNSPGTDVELASSEFEPRPFEVFTPGEEFRTPQRRVPKARIPQIKMPSHQRIPKTPFGKMMDVFKGKSASRVHAATARAADLFDGLSSTSDKEARLAAKEEFKEFIESAWSTTTREYVRFRLTKKLNEFRKIHNSLFVWSLLAQVFMVGYISEGSNSYLILLSSM